MQGSSSSDKYEQIKNKSEKTLVKEGQASLTFLDYDRPNEWKKGDKVKVWIKGQVETSYPGHAKAKKIISVKK